MGQTFPDRLEVALDPAPVSDLKDGALSLLDRRLSLQALIETEIVEPAPGVDQAPLERVVGDDPGVVLDVGRGGDRRRQRGEHLQAPHPQQGSLALQLVRQGQGVDRCPLGEEVEHGPEEIRVSIEVEVVGLQLAHHDPDLIFVQEQRAQDRALGIDVVRGNP